MIVHFIYNDSKFVDKYINFFETNFSDISFYYVLYGRGKSDDIKKYKNIKNVVIINNLYSIKKMLITYELMKKSEKIVFSGIFGIEYFLYFLFDKKIWKKIYINFWGGDFYSFKDKSKNRKYIYNVICKCKCLLFSDYDYQVLTKLFKIEKEYKFTFFPGYKYNIKQYSMNKKDNIINHDIKILLGNSATKENQHIDALNKLSKYSSKKITIYCPLSYGNEKYADTVTEHGQKLFGDHFQPITKFMDYDKYIELLSSCDMAIFNHNRQQSFGNIMMALALGLKVYINEENTLYYVFTNLGCNVYNFSDLNNDTYFDFIRYSNKEIKQNYESIKGLQKKVIDSWKFLYK